MSVSLTRPSSSTRSRSSAGSARAASSASPRSGDQQPQRRARARRAAANASSSTGRPLRGSSIRPRKPERAAVARPAAAAARRRRSGATATPLGISTASPPRCSTSVRRAASRHRDPAADLLQGGLQDRVRRPSSPASAALDVWNVADDRPVGRPAGQQRQARGGRARARAGRRTSPSRSQRRTRAADRNPKVSRATEPL